jgi:anthranilate synthase/aminodeoxychorismate synthase-like glutamine amidotransferase
MRLLLIDNHDSFTYMLRDYLMQGGASCDVMRNDEGIMEHEPSAWDAFIVSPGPSTPEKAGELMPFLRKVVYTKPVLGICLGHQAIGELFGARLIRSNPPMHGKTSLITTFPDAVFKNTDAAFRATRYHSLVLKDIREPLEVIATSDDGEVMAIRHRSLPVRGIQFHPESCQTSFGVQIIKNFLMLANGKC